MGRGHVHFSVGEPPKPAGGSSTESKGGGSNELKGTGSEVEENDALLTKGMDNLTLSDNATAHGNDDDANVTSAPPSSTPIPQNTVISGMRKDCTHLIWVDIPKSIREGDLTWWRSENGVILTEGNEHGIVPLQYIDRVEERKTGKIIWRGGGGGDGDGDGGGKG